MGTKRRATNCPNCGGPIHPRHNHVCNICNGFECAVAHLCLACNTYNCIAPHNPTKCQVCQTWICHNNPGHHHLCPTQGHGWICHNNPGPNHHYCQTTNHGWICHNNPGPHHLCPTQGHGWICHNNLNLHFKCSDCNSDICPASDHSHGICMVCNSWHCSKGSHTQFYCPTCQDPVCSAKQHKCNQKNSNVQRSQDNIFFQPETALEIHHIDTAGGDCTAIIIKRGTQIVQKILIDAGAERQGANRINAYIHRYFYANTKHLPNQFDLFIASHYHADHIKGLQDNQIKSTYYMDTGFSNDNFIPLHGKKISGKSNFFASYKKQLDSCRFRYEIPFINKKNFSTIRKEGKPLQYSGCSFQPIEIFPGSKVGLKLTCFSADGVLSKGRDILGPQLNAKGRTTNPNDHSIAFLLQWGNFTYYTAGDLSGDLTKIRYYNIEEDLINYLSVQGVSAMKASHHGSDHSSHPAKDEKDGSATSNKPFLQTMKPQTIVVPCNMMKGVPGAHFLNRIVNGFNGDIFFVNDLAVQENTKKEKYDALNFLKDNANLSNQDPDDKNIKTSTGNKLSEDNTNFLHNLDTVSVIIKTDKNLIQGSNKKTTLPPPKHKDFENVAKIDPINSKCTSKNYHDVYVMRGIFSGGIKNTIPKFQAFANFPPLPLGKEFKLLQDHLYGLSLKALDYKTFNSPLNNLIGWQEEFPAFFDGKGKFNFQNENEIYEFIIDLIQKQYKDVVVPNGYLPQNAKSWWKKYKIEIEKGLKNKLQDSPKNNFGNFLFYDYSDFFGSIYDSPLGYDERKTLSNLIWYSREYKIKGNLNTFLSPEIDLIEGWQSFYDDAQGDGLIS